MQEFIAKYKDEIQGTLTGFDRLVIGGTLRRLDVCQYVPDMKALRATAMEQYCLSNQIWLKDFAAHVKSVSERIKRASTQPFRDKDLPVIYLPLAARWHRSGVGEESGSISRRSRRTVTKDQASSPNPTSPAQCAFAANPLEGSPAFSR